MSTVDAAFRCGDAAFLGHRKITAPAAIRQIANQLTAGRLEP
jgi:hypothetical protein